MSVFVNSTGHLRTLDNHSVNRELRCVSDWLRLLTQLLLWLRRLPGVWMRAWHLLSAVSLFLQRLPGLRLRLRLGLELRLPNRVVIRII